MSSDANDIWSGPISSVINVKGVQYDPWGFGGITKYFRCRVCGAIVSLAEMHSDWHNAQITVAHGTAMLKDQDSNTGRLAAELHASRRELADASLQLKAVRRLCEVLRAGDSSMPSGFLPGAAIADMIEHRLRDKK